MSGHGTELVAVGKHECVTCMRCACTFAAVHPACPSCAATTRDRFDSRRTELLGHLEYLLEYGHLDDTGKRHVAEVLVRYAAHDAGHSDRAGAGGPHEQEER